MFISQKGSKLLEKTSPLRNFGLKSLSLTMLASKATTTLTASPGFHSAFIKSDGSLWSMGGNGGGQLGINSFEDANLTTEVDVGTLPIMVSLGNPMAGSDLFVNLAKQQSFLSEQGAQLIEAQQVITRMGELKGLSSNLLASDADVSLYNVEFGELQNQLFGISQVSVGGESLFAQFATTSLGNVSSTEAVFGGENQNPSLGHTFETQVEEVGDGVSFGSVSLFSINRSLLLSGVTVDTVSLASFAYSSASNWSGNGADNNQFVATFASPEGGNVLHLDDISVGVFNQVATNISLLRAQNGSEFNAIKQYYSSHVDYEVSKVAVGGGHSIFLLKGDYAYADRSGTSGQLGNGELSNSSTYEFAMSGVKSVAAGSNHSLFLKKDGSLYGTGGNEYGELGLGHENNQSWPTQILDSNVSSVAAGFDHTLVVKEDGSLWGSGKGNNHQLGLNNTANQNQLTEIVSSGVRTAAAGNAHSLFLKDNGSLWGMGGSGHGQLGKGSESLFPTPVEIVSSGVRQISAGQRHSLFIKNDGSVWGMGSNEDGRLGLGDINATYEPVKLFRERPRKSLQGKNIHSF